MKDSRVLGRMVALFASIALAAACASEPPPRPRKVSAPPPKRAEPAPVAAAQCESPDDCLVSRGEAPEGKQWSCFGGVCFAETAIEATKADEPAKKTKPAKTKVKTKKGRKAP